MGKAPPASLIKALQEKKILSIFNFVKHAYKQPKKHPKHINIVALSDICFLIDRFDEFINKTAYKKPTQYTISRQKKITGLLKKKVFKVVITKDISNNI